MATVALFPIPNAVAFPGTIFPLHVFEPRYRKLVQDCVEEQRMVGISHVIKAIHTPAEPKTLEKALSSNQTTYKPRQVFCAGHCEIIETTSDGRILTHVHIEQRLTLERELQSLPYRIVDCAPLLDEPDDQDVAANRELQQQINTALQNLLTKQNPGNANRLNTPQWLTLTPAEFSFKIFQHIQLDADIMQDILEMPSANARLNLIWQILSQ